MGANGDVDELLALELHNIGAEEYDFVRRHEWITFRITDSPATCVSAHDPLNSSNWSYATQNGVFVLAAQPAIGIQAGQVRTFGAHLIRPKRASVSKSRVYFDDPIPLDTIDPAVVRQGRASAIVILPQRHEGWRISSPEAATILTTRLARFDFTLGPGEWQPVRLSGRASCDEIPLLSYDDIIADLNVLLGQTMSGQRPDHSRLIEKVERLSHTAVQSNTARLCGGLKGGQGTQIAQLRQAIDKMVGARTAFFREITVANPAKRVSARSLWPPVSSLETGTPENLLETAIGTTPAPLPIELFVAYSSKDEPLRNELAAHLAHLTRSKVIQSWHEGEVGAGADWEAEIHEHLESARFLVLLVSADFLASRYCAEAEISQFLARHDAGQLAVIPILIRACAWTGTPFGQLQALPRNGLPITSWANRDEAWTSVVSEIEVAVRSCGASEDRNV